MNQENKYLFKFAFKSIHRNAGRSFFIGFSVSLAVFIAVWVLAFFDGMNSQIERAVVNTNTGFFQIHEKNYSRTTDSAFPQKLTPALIKKLENPEIFGYSPELVLDGNISTPEGAAGLLVLGIDPSLHQKFLHLSQNLVKGSFFENVEENSIVIGEELAKIFKFNVGDQLVLNYQDVSGDLRSEILVISGVFRFSSHSFEKRFSYVNQKTWQRLYLNHESSEILFNRIALMTKNLKPEEFLKKEFKDTDLDVKTWKNLNPEMAVVIEFNDGMIKFFFIIIGLTIIMTILTPVQMLWQERFKEIRMMNVLGVSNKRFWKLGIFEVIQMIFFSGLTSSIFLAIILSIQSRTGVNFDFDSKGVQIERAGIKLTGNIYPHLSAYQIGVTFIFIIFVLGFSYLWSIHRTLKKLEVESA